MLVQRHGIIPHAHASRIVDCVGDGGGDPAYAELGHARDAVTATFAK